MMFRQPAPPGIAIGNSKRLGDFHACASPFVAPIVGTRQLFSTTVRNIKAGTA
jgi:hypothetical protein